MQMTQPKKSVEEMAREFAESVQTEGPEGEE